MAGGLQRYRVESGRICSALGQEKGARLLLDSLLWLLLLLDSLLWLLLLYHPDHTTSL